MKDNINSVNLTELNSGLHSDTAPSFQPKGTQRFGLNVVNETNEGEEMIRSNEESNEVYANIKTGYVFLGKVYIGNNQNAIFLVSADNSISEIGILQGKNKYITHVNDELSDADDKLNFRIDKQIQATFRLRKGCERTVYFTDSHNRPRYYNFDKPSDFKTAGNTWDGKKFSLFRTYASIPKFENVEVKDVGGFLKPGSYNIAIQLLDEALNPTEWITVSDTILIYNDSLSNEFTEIAGSIMSTEDYLNFSATTKLIQVTMSDIDTSYPFFRLAFIESNVGDGLITAVKLTSEIPTGSPTFTYTGENATSTGTQEELLFFNNMLYKADSIEQVENRLVLANTSGAPINFCKLQKYASKIQADCTTKKVILNDVNDPANSKNPLQNLGGIGYMPGEIYSFGIVFVYEGGETPVYHIPGKNPSVPEGLIYSQVLDEDENPTVYPMSKDNQGVSVYTENESCDSNGVGIWGLDSEGETLLGKPIRHHRFPLRSKINKPLVTKITGDELENLYYCLELKIAGRLKTPVVCDPEDVGCTPVSVPDFTIKVSYKVNGEDFSFALPISPAFYADNTGTYILDIYKQSNFHTSNNFTDIVVEWINTAGNLVPEDATVWAEYFTDDYTTEGVHTVTVENVSSTLQEAAYQSEIFGIKFSNIEKPSLEDTNGVEILGYYIVRNERKETDKTILDSGVITPSLTNDKYISHGLFAPELADTSKISPTVYGLIHPEHKFNQIEYTEYDEIIQEGRYNIDDRKKSLFMYNDVYDGTSYDGDEMKDGNDDGKSPDGEPLTRGKDGWSLNVIARDNILSYESRNKFTILKDKIKERFYLKALEFKDVDEKTKVIYNIAADNRVGMLYMNEENLVKDTLPYVLLKRYNEDSYSNYRTLPYYRETANIQSFNDDTCVVFNGDSYITPMRYTNTVFWDARVAKRKSKGSTIFGTFVAGGLGKWIAGIVLIIVGVVLLIWGGSGAFVIGAGIAVIGGGAMIVSSGIEAAAIEKAYMQEYDLGLRKTALDDWVDMFFNYKNGNPFGYTGGTTVNDGPSDDCLQWIGECATDLWFESAVNMSLRNGMTSDASPYLAAPGLIETGNNTPLACWEYYGIRYLNGNVGRYPISKLDFHLAKKLLVTDAERNDNRLYIGVPLGEYYNLNPDYKRRNKEKIYHHLPFEYECCSDCQEKFPHRWHWSEQSLQEELVDNYRTFLPNNYKDLDGETGQITNLFRINNDLFIHTEEALYRVIRDYQERVTDQIISFIGSGSYGAIPPQKIIDDDSGNSAGSQHKWGMIKTPNGVFFPSGNQSTIFKFDGKQLSPISNTGINNWFKNNIKSLAEDFYLQSNDRPYPYRNNPSNPVGTGYISTYDARKERIIFTKRDFDFVNKADSDFELCFNNGSFTNFPGFSATIAAEQAAGWTFVGIEDCKLKFQKDTIEQVVSTREIRDTQLIPNATTIHVFYDTTSMGQAVIDTVKASIISWYQSFRPNDTLDVNGNGTGLKHHLDSTERWLSFPSKLIPGESGYLGFDETGKDVIVLSFVDEANPIYHENGISDYSIPASTTQPTPTYQDDYHKFAGIGIYAGDGIYDKFNSFIGINYPILRGTVGNVAMECLGFLQHSIAAIYGHDMTTTEINNLKENSLLTVSQWDNLKASLVTNPYKDVVDGLELRTPGLLNYNWRLVTNKNVLGSGATDNCPASTEIITACNLEEDIEGLLLDINQSVISTEEILVDTVVTQTKYIEGELYEESLNDNSWTMSYSLKQGNWVSWHSYLPNFYINTPRDFFSWKAGNDNIWKHNVKGSYQNFYGNGYPFILEYVSVSSPIATRVFDSISLIAEVQRFDADTNEFYDVNDTFFNRMIVYNSRQCSGELALQLKESNVNSNYLMSNVTNAAGVAIVDRNERDWSINGFRDMRTDYSKPIFTSNLASLQSNYFIDKIVNTATINPNKSWMEQESFRDKYLVTRLIFDNFAGNTKILMDFSVEKERMSAR